MKKDLLILFAVILALAVVIGGSEIQSVDEYYLQHIDDVTPGCETVTMSIDCSEILTHRQDLDPALADYVPPDGLLLPETVFVLREGDTAFDLLSRAARYYHIQMEYQGADKNAFSTVYVRGIGYFYEFSCGAYSGWTYRVNGASPTVGCSDFTLSDGDQLTWLYSCSLDGF